jgi:hypothetical protein
VTPICLVAVALVKKRYAEEHLLKLRNSYFSGAPIVVPLPSLLPLLNEPSDLIKDNTAFVNFCLRAPLLPPDSRIHPVIHVHSSRVCNIVQASFIFFFLRGLLYNHLAIGIRLGYLSASY